MNVPDSIKIMVFPIVKVAAMIAIGMISILAWDHFRPTYNPVGSTVVATPAKPLGKIGTETTQTAPVKTYKPEAKKKLNLPEPVQQDAKQHILGAAVAKPDFYPHTYTPVLNTETGETTIYDTRGPLPLIEVTSNGQVGVALGIRNGYQTIRIDADQKLLNVKAVTIGIQGSVDLPVSGPMKPDYFVGIGFHWRWQ